MRVVIETIKKTKYEAYDGTRFDNENDCVEYETNIKTILKEWENVPKLEYSEESLHLGGGYSDVHYVIYCRDEKDVEATNTYLKECGGRVTDLVSSEDVGKRVVVSVWDIDTHRIGNGVSYFGSSEEIIKDIANLLYAPIAGVDDSRQRIYSISADC